MPRARSTAVSENLEALQELESSITKKSVRAHITMLRMLKENPSLHLKDVAQVVGYSETAVKRWWRLYEKAGIGALLNGSQDINARKVRDLELLAKRLRDGDFESVDEAQVWIAGLREKRSKRKHHIPSYDGSEGRQYRKFLNALPTTADTVPWIQEFRSAFKELFDDVDQISMSVNIHCDLITPGLIEPNMGVIQHYDGDHLSIEVGKRPEVHHHAERLLESLRKKGQDLTIYHPPITFEYHYGNEYLGVVILWRLRHRPPISQKTIDLVTELEPFIVFMFSDQIARKQYYNPAPHKFLDAVDKLSMEANFTPQEREIIVLQAMGQDLNTIASKLNISTHTLNSHLKTIYQKAKVRNFRELYGIYLTRE